MSDIWGTGFDWYRSEFNGFLYSTMELVTLSSSASIASKWWLFSYGISGTSKSQSIYYWTLDLAIYYWPLDSAIWIPGWLFYSWFMLANSEGRIRSPSWRNGFGLCLRIQLSSFTRLSRYEYLVMIFVLFGGNTPRFEMSSRYVSREIIGEALLAVWRILSSESSFDSSFPFN